MSHFQCDNCGGMKYAANITRKPGGINMASACGKCDGHAAISSIQQMELASLAIHDDPKNRTRAVRNMRIAEHGDISLEGQLLKAQNAHEDEAELRDRFEAFAQPAPGTGKHRAQGY